MYTVISDNLTIGDVLEMCKKKGRRAVYTSNYSFKQYLYALVLWDTIYAPNNRESVSRFALRLNANAQKDPFIRDILNSIHEFPFKYMDLQVMISHIYSQIEIENTPIASAAVFYLALGKLQI